LETLIIDIGNSRIKIAVFQASELRKEFSCASLDEAKAILENLSFAHVLISSVKYDYETLCEYFPFPFIYLSADTPVPLQNLYATPHTLGVDRKAAVIGARSKINEGPLLVIDMGTCITIDFLTSENEFLGGAISPGVSMRFKAMNQFTARLPLTDLDQKDLPKNLIGKSTLSGLQSGVYHGVKYEIEGYIKEYHKQYEQIKVIICGGDSILFESLTKDHIFVIPNLVLFGLNRILCYNVNKK
jgi:type III pantothenate kinase